MGRAWAARYPNANSRVTANSLVRLKITLDDVKPRFCAASKRR